MTTGNTRVLCTAALVLGLAGCAGMSDLDRNTPIGAGVGAVAGSVLTGMTPGRQQKTPNLS